MQAKKIREHFALVGLKRLIKQSTYLATIPDGRITGIIPCVVGASYAVLVAEQLFFGPQNF